ncbi:formate dehydrogenase accessory sulfurtransferase FdhD [Psychrobacter vallis]|uniref:formate dehydrogenase accessory sulfurtransferase FdhD n=1 Tax=Psychrobacter vallis TaxID=248451 RepID=UPI001D0FB453|nr:formate dehydrogenase accessory sulfurtransferase FdhD [Psychrobacter vallis]
MTAHTHMKEDDQFDQRFLSNKNSEASEIAITPLSRTHLSQKHAYLSNKPQVIGQTHIDCQPVSLAVEAAIAIVINGIHYAVLMASPHQLEYLAIGFLFSEGLIHHSHELLDWEVNQLTDIVSYQRFTQDLDNENIGSAEFEKISQQLQDYDIYVVELILNQRCHQRIQAQKRQLAGRTGCGMCGITGLTQALPDLSSYSQSNLPNNNCNNLKKKAVIPSLDTLLQMRQEVDKLQHIHQLTGAVHAAATVHQQALYLFEDVGRHNALDKLIGWQLRQKIEVECVLMTSRLSIELVQKSIRGHIPWLVGMSAPTSTAVRIAERYGLGLAGFLRHDRVTYYSGYSDC